LVARLFLEWALKCAQQDCIWACTKWFGIKSHVTGKSEAAQLSTCNVQEPMFACCSWAQCCAALWTHQGEGCWSFFATQFMFSIEQCFPPFAEHLLRTHSHALFSLLFLCNNNEPLVVLHMHLDSPCDFWEQACQWRKQTRINHANAGFFGFHLKCLIQSLRHLCNPLPWCKSIPSQTTQRNNLQHHLARQPN